jgi:hypothetical protein
MTFSKHTKDEILRTPPEGLPDLHWQRIVGMMVMTLGGFTQ